MQHANTAKAIITHAHVGTFWNAATLSVGRGSVIGEMVGGTGCRVAVTVVFSSNPSS